MDVIRCASHRSYSMPSRVRKPRSETSPRSAAKAPRRPYHHGDLGNALLDAASEAIAQHGLGQLRIRDLTRRLGVSHGAPANHFKDRDALLIALAVQGFERLIERQREVLAESHETPVAGLIAIGIAYVQFAADHPSHFEVMFQRRLLLHDRELAGVAARCFEQLLGAVAAIAPKPSKSDGRKHHELSALGAWALAHGLATLQTQGLLPADRSDVAKVANSVLAAMTELAPAVKRSR
jgi:AcrR family transcriptional regulator